MSSNVATTVHALNLGKAIRLKLDGPETYDRWHHTIMNVMKETMCTAARSGEFRDMTVYQCIFEREDNQDQHQATQIFAQQLLTSTIEAKNFDLIKAIPESNPDNQEDMTYNRAKLQFEVLKEEYKSQSLPVLSSFYIELENLRVADFQKKGIKSSKALTLFFQKQADLVHKISEIPDGKPNMKLLLINTKRHLPQEMRRWAQDAKTLEELKTTLVHNTRLWIDDVETEEQVFNATERNKRKKTDQYCFNYAATGFCRFGRRCRFDHIAESQPQNAGEFPTGRGLQLSSGRQFAKRHPYHSYQPIHSPAGGVQLSSGRTVNVRRQFGPRVLRPPSGNQMRQHNQRRGLQPQSQAYVHQHMQGIQESAEPSQGDQRSSVQEMPHASGEIVEDYDEDLWRGCQ